MIQQDLKVIRLETGEQVVSYVSHEEGSMFIRLIEPLEIRMHTEVNDYGTVNEQMSLVEWILHTDDNVFSIHRDRIVTIAKADTALIDYYGYTKRSFEKLKQKALEDKNAKDSIKKLEQSLKQGNEKMSRKEMLDILTGKVTKH